MLQKLFHDRYREDETAPVSRIDMQRCDLSEFQKMLARELDKLPPLDA